MTLRLTVTVIGLALLALVTLVVMAPVKVTAPLAVVLVAGLTTAGVAAALDRRRAAGATAPKPFTKPAVA
jgi:hypothetical protein